MAVVASTRHRIGIGWRPEIASFILTHQDIINDVEIIIENIASLPEAKLESFRYLSSQFNLHFHGVSLGIACSGGIPAPYLKKLNRFFKIFPTTHWSDHFSFVRSHDIELGHLAAPSWNDHTSSIVCKNLDTLRQELGQIPILENVSTLIQPPLSTYTEAEWVSKTLRDSNSMLLLDINNVYCNALNFGRDPFMELSRYPFERIQQIHMSGGKWVQYPNKRHMLDDHKHDIPEIGFQMLDYVLARLNHGVSIVIERDGNYPESSILLSQLKRIQYLIQLKDRSNELCSR